MTGKTDRLETSHRTEIRIGGRIVSEKTCLGVGGRS